MTEQLETHLRAIYAQDAERAPVADRVVRHASGLARHRQRVRTVWAGAAVVAGTTAAMLALGGPSQAPGPVDPVPAITGEGAVPDSGMAMCAESYDVGDPVTGRDFAFDGTVTAIGPAQTSRGEAEPGLASVTFAVTQWYAGGSGETVTVDVNAPQLETMDGPPAYGVGTRLLVSGEPRWGGAPLDDPIAWGCGFTRYYDDATASDWAKAFG